VISRSCFEGPFAVGSVSVMRLSGPLASMLPSRRPRLCHFATHVPDVPALVRRSRGVARFAPGRPVARPGRLPGRPARAGPELRRCCLAAHWAAPARRLRQIDGHLPHSPATTASTGLHPAGIPVTIR
jgi:hypothetical protein